LQCAGFAQLSQQVYRGPAPFLLTEAVTTHGARVATRPWSGITVPLRTGAMSQ
jgi:hypothetical protein